MFPHTIQNASLFNGTPSIYAIFKLFLTNLEKVDNSTIYSGKSIYIDSEDIDEYKLKQIYDIIKDNNGNRQVYIKTKTDIGMFVYKFSKTTNKKAEDLIKELVN
jgi:hypothetical protein